jgi:hypothetical protein
MPTIVFLPEIADASPLSAPPVGRPSIVLLPVPCLLKKNLP